MPKRIKVAIIGAGPSGFGAAEALRNDENRDRFDITIFERNTYVGGKCHTVDQYGKVNNGAARSYEVGATVISKTANEYKDLAELIRQHGIAVKPFRTAERKLYKYLKAQTEHNFLEKGLNFVEMMESYDAYLNDYMHRSWRYKPDYSHRSKYLAKSLSKIYDKKLNQRLSGIMQAFGYADLKDNNLSPALLYYHQYLEPKLLKFPLYTIEKGTQSIWQKLAQSYPKNTILLNQSVNSIQRHSNTVRVRTAEGHEDFDKLIIATPFKPALQFLDLQPRQKKFLSKMNYNHYVSILCQTDDLAGYTGLFNVAASTTRSKIGDVMCVYQRYADSNHIVTYLYLKPGKINDDQEIINRLETSLKRDFGLRLINKNRAKVYHWDDYFGHLDSKDIKVGWYDKFESEYQNQDNTLYLSSGLHMETVGASYGYGLQTTKRMAKQW